MIKAINLSKAYHQTCVFQNLNLEISAGRFVAIMGESGSGKSTLLNLIAGLDQTKQGQLEVAGVQLVGQSKADLVTFRRNHLSMIFQDFHLLSGLNALDNLILPLRLSGKKASRDHLLHCLSQVGMSDKKNLLPQQLSGGEQQRVAIARALCFEPDVLLADEPTGNLDAKNAQRVLELLSNLQKEKKTTLVMVTHSKKAAHYADQTFLMENIQWQQPTSQSQP